VVVQTIAALLLLWQLLLLVLAGQQAQAQALQLLLPLMILLLLFLLCWCLCLPLKLPSLPLLLPINACFSPAAAELSRSIVKQTCCDSCTLLSVLQQDKSPVLHRLIPLQQLQPLFLLQLLLLPPLLSGGRIQLLPPFAKLAALWAIQSLQLSGPESMQQKCCTS
jgi:hypothetical protein